MVVNWNLGKGRTVDAGLKIHRSVKIRMSARCVDGKDEPYSPRILVKIGNKEQRLEEADWLKERHFHWVD